MSEHTPGPWEYCDRPYWMDGVRYVAGGWAIMSGSYCLAEAAKEADAALIAAAPQLLEACKMAREAFEDPDPDIYSQAERACIAAIRAVEDES